MNSSHIVTEPSQQEWGGVWTRHKLDAFTAYVKAYLRIMNSNPYWKTIYFDGFAGTGEIIKQKPNIRDLFEDDIPDEINVYKGSVVRVLENAKNIFDYYYFIDSDSNNVRQINEVKSNIKHIQQDRIIVRNSDCNQELSKLAEALRSNNYAALIFIDPFGMQVNWESIAKLKNTRSDIWILIPSGVAINRLLPRSGEIKNKLLEKFFGLSIEQIKTIFYSKETKQTLFGDEEITTKRQNSIDKIVLLYIAQLKTVWKFVSEKPLVLKNSVQSPIFHLLFASNNVAAIKIASQIIKIKQK